MLSLYYCWKLILHIEFFGTKLFNSTSPFREVKKKKKSQNSYDPKSDYFLPGTKLYEKLGRATEKENIRIPNPVLMMLFIILFEKNSANSKTKVYATLHYLNFTFLILEFVITQNCSTSKMLNCNIMIYDHNHLPIHLWIHFSKQFLFFQLFKTHKSIFPFIDLLLFQTCI